MDGQENQEVKQETQAQQAVQPKSGGKGGKKNENPPFGQRVRTFFTDLRGEARKIVWPDRKSLQKQTVTVIFTSLLFALVIFGIDSVYNVILQFGVGLLR